MHDDNPRQDDDNNSSNENSSIQNPRWQRQRQRQPALPRDDSQQQRQRQRQQPIRHTIAVPSPSDIDGLLSRELMQLSLRTRNNIQEEIHGVKCLARTETPEFVSSSLRKLDASLDGIPPSERANPLLRARRRGRLGGGQESFVDTVDFKLRFLRKCFFDVAVTTKSIVEFSYRLQSIFGDVALRRPIILHKDFNKSELREFRKGRYQLLPFRDRSGRRILVIFPDEEMEQMEPVLREKIVAYLFGVASKGDEETQRKGLVVIVWFDASYKISYRMSMRDGAMTNYLAFGCMRIAAIHVCSPDTPLFRLRRSFTALKAYPFRSRLKMHAGEPVELFYGLQGYGIPTETIPMTWSGTVKNVHLRNWMKIQKVTDCHEEISMISRIVECPNSNDVIFRQGTAMYCHPGNARFRSLVEATVTQLQDSITISNSTGIVGEEPIIAGASEIDEFGENSTTTKKLISDLVDHIIDFDKGRVLVWITNHSKEKYGYGCWCTIAKKEQIYPKIEYIVREHIRGGSGQPEAAAAQTTTTATTSVTTAAAQAAAAATTTTTPISKAERQKSNLQSTDSSTSIFRQQTSSDRCSPLPDARPKPRDESPSKRAKTSSSTAGAPSDDNYIFISRTAER